MRKILFQNGEYYHIFNRGVDKREIFLKQNDYVRFIYNLRFLNNSTRKEEREYFFKNLPDKNSELSSGYPELSSIKVFLEKFSDSKLVDIVCYCLNNNHYHFLVKQKAKDGIPRFFHKINLAYTNYFNFKYKRSGSLFQGTYKAKHINTDNYLLKLSCYINGNPEIHKISKAKDWQWSSYKDYLGIRNGTLCEKEIILKDFQNNQEYRELTNYVIKDSSEFKELVLE